MCRSHGLSTVASATEAISFFFPSSKYFIFHSSHVPLRKKTHTHTQHPPFPSRTLYLRSGVVELRRYNPAPFLSLCSNSKGALALSQNDSPIERNFSSTRMWPIPTTAEREDSSFYFVYICCIGNGSNFRVFQYRTCRFVEFPKFAFSFDDFSKRMFLCVLKMCT